MKSNEAPRPLNLGEILDRTVQLYRERFLVFLGIAILPAGTVLIFAGSFFLALAWFGTAHGTSNARVFNVPASSFLVLLFVVVMSLLAVPVLLGVSSLSEAAMNHAAAEALAGERPGIRSSFAKAWRRGWQYVWLYVLQALIVWVAPLIVWFVAVAVLGATGGAVGLARGSSGAATLIGLLTLFGFAAVVGFAIWMLLCVGLAFPACVVENIDAGRSLTRSIRLSRGTRGRIFVLYLLGAVLGWILSILVTLIFFIGIALIPALNKPENSQALGMTMIFLIYGSSFAVQAFTKPIFGISLMLFYYDQRIRKEGYDIEWMMERAGLEPGGAPTTASNVESIALPTRIGASAAIEATSDANMQTAIRSTEQFGIVETTESTEATQPESEVQE